ncbi:DUF1611 domain-containing protein [Georgenia deserti]|uniref:DUF1611 domain-containing protein n=1 Tax=Georgenia deserti TaxID=2093781 RepID=A0ABW4L6Z7_9MICO
MRSASITHLTSQNLARPAHTGRPGQSDVPVVLSPAGLAHALVAYSASRVDLTRARAVLTDGVPRFGDLVLAAVTGVGQHARLENQHGRKAPLTEGVQVVAAYGTRYAPDQFEAVVPDDLGPCELVAAGGIAGRVLSQHAQVKDATRIEPIGILLDAGGRRLNTTDGAWFPTTPHSGVDPVVMLVTGSSMNSGKTTTGAMLCRGLRAAGFQVGAAKVTGTGAGNDMWAFHDNGARPVVDFTHAGYPSTWQVPLEELVRIYEQSVDHLAAAGCDVAVIEVADGIYQPETAALLRHPAVRARHDGILFAATDPLCATAGYGWLREQGFEPLAVTGVLSASVLGTREFTAVIDHPVWDSSALSDATRAAHLVRTLLERREAAG